MIAKDKKAVAATIREYVSHRREQLDQAWSATRSQGRLGANLTIVHAHEKINGILNELENLALWLETPPARAAEPEAEAKADAK